VRVRVWVRVFLKMVRFGGEFPASALAPPEHMPLQYLETE